MARTSSRPTTSADRDGGPSHAMPKPKSKLRSALLLGVAFVAGGGAVHSLVHKAITIHHAYEAFEAGIHAITAGRNQLVAMFGPSRSVDQPEGKYTERQDKAPLHRTAPESPRQARIQQEIIRGNSESKAIVLGAAVSENQNLMVGMSVDPNRYPIITGAAPGVSVEGFLGADLREIRRRLTQ